MRVRQSLTDVERAYVVALTFAWQLRWRSTEPGLMPTLNDLLDELLIFAGSTLPATSKGLVLDDAYRILQADMAPRL